MRFTLFLVFVLAGGAFAQRVDEWDAAKVAVRDRAVTLSELPDGGCALVQVCGRLPSVDGGSQLQNCKFPRIELKGGNRTTCVQVLDKAGTWWANQEAASSADSGL